MGRSISIAVAALAFSLCASPAEAENCRVVCFASQHLGFFSIGTPRKDTVAPELIEQAQALSRDSRYTSDGANADYWRIDFEGDCEDKSLAALAWLAERGVSRDAMRVMVSPAIGSRVAHAILCIWTPGGVWCVDNLQQRPTRLKDIPGQWYDALGGSEYHDKI